MSLPIVPTNCELLLLSYSYESRKKLVASPHARRLAAVLRAAKEVVSVDMLSDTPCRARAAAKLLSRVATAGLLRG